MNLQDPAPPHPEPPRYSFVALPKEGHTNVGKIEVGPGVRLHAAAVGDVLKPIAGQPCPPRAGFEPQAKTRLVDEIERRGPHRNGLTRIDDAAAGFSEGTKPALRA